MDVVREDMKLGEKKRMQQLSAGRYTGSYRILVFIFLMIVIFHIPQYQ